MITSEFIEEQTKKFIDNGGIVNKLEPQTETSLYIISGVDSEDYEDIQTILLRETDVL